MNGVGQVERKTQDRIIKLFSDSDKLDYKYLGNWHDRENNSNIEEKYLHKYLVKKGYSKQLINRAIEMLVNAANNQVDKLYYVNKEVSDQLQKNINILKSNIKFYRNKFNSDTIGKIIMIVMLSMLLFGIVMCIFNG